MHVVEFNYSACRRRGGVLNSPHFCFFLIIFILLNLERTTNSFFKQHKTLSNLPFQRFIPISAFYWFYPPFSFRFQFPFPPFSFSVLSRPTCRRRGGVLNSPHFCFFFLFFLFCLIWSEQQIRFFNSTKLFRTCHFSVLSPFQRFILISAFYPHFSVLSPFQFPFSVSVSAIQFQRFIH